MKQVRHSIDISAGRIKSISRSDGLASFSVGSLIPTLAAVPSGELSISTQVGCRVDRGPELSLSHSSFQLTEFKTYGTYPAAISSLLASSSSCRFSKNRRKAMLTGPSLSPSGATSLLFLKQNQSHELSGNLFKSVVRRLSLWKMSFCFIRN